MRFPDDEDVKHDFKSSVKIEPKAKKEETRFSMVPQSDSFDDHSSDFTFIDGHTDDSPSAGTLRDFHSDSERITRETTELPVGRVASTSRERTAHLSSAASTSEPIRQLAHSLEGDLSELSDLTCSDPEEDALSETNETPDSINLSVKSLRDFLRESSTIRSVRTKCLTLPAFIIHHALKRMYFPRAFISDEFGGTSQTFLQTLRSGIKCAFPKRIMNPAVAASPGQPGLMFASRVEITSNPPWYVFSQNESESGRVVWEYVGGYESKVQVGELRGSTFKGLPEDVKRAWGKLLASSKSHRQDVYVSLRARVALRKSGVAVDSEGEQLEMAEIRAGRGYVLDGKDIVEALTSGEEGIKILEMRCTSYDHAFVEELIAKRRNWTPKPRKEKMEKKGKMLKSPANSSHSHAATDMYPKVEDNFDPGPSSSRERRKTRRQLDLNIDYGELEENIDDDPSYKAGESSGGED